MNAKSMIAIIVGVIVATILTVSVLTPILATSNDYIDNIHYNGGNEYCVRMSHGAPEADLYFTKPANEMYVECRSGSLSAEPYYVAPLNDIHQMGWIFLSSSFSLGITGMGDKPLDTTSKYNGQGAGGYNTVADTKNVHINSTTGKVTIWTTDPDSTWSAYDNVDLDTCYWADPNGEYINVQVGRYPVWIEDPTEIAGSSMTQGNYIFYTDTENVTVTSTYPATVSTETTEYYGLYSLTRVPMEITGADSSVNNVTSAHVVVEYKVQGDPVISNSGSLLSMLSVIPVMIIAGIVVAVAGAFIIGKNDY